MVRQIGKIAPTARLRPSLSGPHHEPPQHPLVERPDIPCSGDSGAGGALAGGGRRDAALGAHVVNTAFLLMAQYDGQVIIPIDTVRRDYFSHLTTDHLIRKISAGDIDLPMVRMETSQKAAKGVALLDLATYLDGRISAARKENRQLLAS